MGMLSREAIEAMGFASLGGDLHISEKASFYGVGRIALGSHVRIDDFCVLSAGAGGIQVGSYVHIAVGSSLIGAGRITLGDFCNLSSRVAIYSSSDDYSGVAMTNPMVPIECTDVTHAAVILGSHVIVGCGSVILPGVRLEVGVAVGALSLINQDCAAFGIYVGVPARQVKERNRNLLQVERALRQKAQAGRVFQSNES